MSKISQLVPQEVFAIFDEITRIPRPSKHEQAISEWLQQFARQHGLEYVVDEAMNVIIRKPASPGCENHPGVILQAHQDMVCEKDPDAKIDFLTDPIDAYIDGDWIRAHGTTLGGDDGIGMAMALAVMIDDQLVHPALECLFTVDEETGLTGANKLQDGYLHGQQLINLDNEDDGQICIGCAGGIDTVGRMHYQPEALAEGNWFAVCLQVSGLLGGHSGADIHLGRANAIRLLSAFLSALQVRQPMRLACLQGGNLRNAIARDAEAIVCVPMEYKEQLRIDWNIYSAQMEEQWGSVETTMRFDLDSCDMPQDVMSQRDAIRLLQTLNSCPHGVVAMCHDIPDLVETSTNLASVKCIDSTCVEICTSQRSSVEKQKEHIRSVVAESLSVACDEIRSSEGYPGWAPNVHSPLLDITRQAYRDLYHQEAQVLAIHAGLECGLFLEKYPQLDMVSFGPQMYDVHSPQERLSISSTYRCYVWLCKTLELLTQVGL